MGVLHETPVERTPDDMIGVSKQVHICLLDRKKGKHEKEVQ
jgi:hypothetical protein